MRLQQTSPNWAYEPIAFKASAQNYEILANVIGLDPLAPLTRADDLRWSAIVDWVAQGLIEAEELGASQSNLPEMRKSADILTQRLLGANQGFGTIHRLR